jgi:hypothetical protein
MFLHKCRSYYYKFKNTIFVLAGSIPYFHLFVQGRSFSIIPTRTHGFSFFFLFDPEMDLATHSVNKKLLDIIATIKIQHVFALQ